MTEIGKPLGADDHPTWCELSRSCSGDNNPRHLGRRSVWGVEADDVCLELQIARNDDGVPDQALYPGFTRVLLAIHNTACVDERGNAVYADVDLYPSDARELAEKLMRYADACEVEYADVDRRHVEIDGLRGAT